VGLVTGKEAGVEENAERTKHLIVSVEGNAGRNHIIKLANIRAG